MGKWLLLPAECMLYILFIYVNLCRTIRHSFVSVMNELVKSHWFLMGRSRKAMTMKRPCIKQTCSPDSSAQAVISICKTCPWKLSVKRKRFHMAGAPLAGEVKSSISSGIGQVLENKEQKGKGNNIVSSLNTERSRRKWALLLNSHIIIH